MPLSGSWRPTGDSGSFSRDLRWDSIAIKIVGVWYVAAVLLAILAWPLLDDARDVLLPPVRIRPYAAIVVFSAVATLAVTGAAISGQPGSGEIVGLLLPIVALCIAVALLGLNAWRDSSPIEYVGALKDAAALLTGLCAPLALFIAPYLMTQSFGDLVEGVFIAPLSRFEYASFSMPPLSTLSWAAPIVAIALVLARTTGRRRATIDVVASSVVAFLVLTASSEPSYRILWSTTRALAPLVVVLGAAAIIWKSRLRTQIDGPSRPARGAGRRLLGARPVSIRPTRLLLLRSAAHDARRTCRLSPTRRHKRSTSCRCTSRPSYFWRATTRSAVDFVTGTSLCGGPQTAILDAERASIRVEPEEKNDYDEVLTLVARHRRDSEPIAGPPDAPEIYFLAELRTRRRSILDFLDPSGSTRGNKLIGLLETEPVGVVVLNHDPLQSPPLTPGTLARIRMIYPHGQHVGRFEVRWRAQRSSTR